jgi:hypothetical protein
MADSIEQLMAQLGGMSYHAPSSYKSPSFDFKLPKYKSIDLTPYNFTQKDFKSLATPKKGSGNSDINWWDVLSGTLGQTSGVVTNSLYNVIHDIKDTKKSLGRKILDIALKDNIGASIAQGLVNGGAEQLKDWKDGHLSWGDIPGIGLLHGMDKGWKRGEDIVHDELGVNNKWGKVGGGIGLDILLDPLTYFTGGLSAAAKLGKAAELAKTAELAKGLGMVGKFKSSEKFLQSAEHAIKSDLIKRNPKVAAHIIDKTVAKKMGKLADEIKTARNTTYNAHVNDWGFSAPFSKKVLTAGKYGEKNLLHNSEALAPQKLVDDLLHEASHGDAKLKSTLITAIKHRYDVGSTGELTKTMFDDLHGFVSPIIDTMKRGGIPDVKVIQQVVSKTLPHADFTRLMDEVRTAKLPWKDVQKQLDEILNQVGKNPKLRSSFGSHLAEMVSDYWKHKPAKNFSKAANERKAESMKWVSSFMKDSDKYQTLKTTMKDIHPHGDPVKNMNKLDYLMSNSKGGGAIDKMMAGKFNEMGDFKSNIGHFVDKKNPFDARTLATGDKFTNSMGEHIADAHSQRIGETARYSRSLDKISNFVKGFTGDKQQLMEQAIYLLENHAPEHLGGKAFLANAPKESQELANLIKPVIDRLGSQESGAGVLDKLRKNYFPHVVNHDSSILNDMADFISRHKDLNGLKGTSKFNQERKTFQTLASRDDYLAKIEKAIQKETDPDTIETLRKQQERVASMFDTDVVSALQRRIKEGVRAKAMKELQGKLGKYNMMKTIKTGKENIPDGYHEISPEEAKKLGLGKGRHYIHPDVFKGMKRIDEIFTNEGMNKLVRHVSAVADIWRPLVTYYKPSHYLNNIIGNVINNMAAGVKFNDYKAAEKLVRGYRTGKLGEQEMKIMEHAYKHNVISGGFLQDAHPTYRFTETGKLEKIAKTVGDNKVIRQVRHLAGEQADDISRLANFINGMGKYGKVSMAAKQVRTYLFNYNELTNADRTMRVMVPFWNWTKRNIPLQLKLLKDNPKFALNNMRLLKMFNDHEKGADWQKQTGIKVPGTNYYKSVPSPVNDLGQLANPREFLGSMTPAAKMPIEMLMNKKFFTGKPISYGSDNLKAEDLAQYLASNLGIGGNAYDSFSGRKTVGESLINLFGSISKINPNGN